MPNLINEIIVRQLSDEFAKAESIVVVSISGLTVAETENLRNSLAKDGVRLRMVRNRLARRALASRGFEGGQDLFQGNVACAWGSTEDAIRIAKVVSGAFKDVDAKRGAKLAFRGGIFEGNLLDAGSAAALADLPSKDELRAMMLGILSGPARSLAVLLQGPGASLARLLQARVDKGEGPAAPEAGA